MSDLQNPPAPPPDLLEDSKKEVAVNEVGTDVATSTTQDVVDSSSDSIRCSADSVKAGGDGPKAARPSGLPKPTGLKPPSKIGRLCSNASPKPAVPVSPRGDGVASDIARKYSDDFSRKHLADLVEADEETEGSRIYSPDPDRASRYQRKASTSSTFSVTSMDALWEKHPRRLSEAGLRRSSDHSIVLTEDTDSFIIGDRVWVGGTKPGQIAYIGETQFAPGDWAGIVLDEPIGKNDGSVAGFRYFQCAERRGVFSRLRRLSRVPLEPPQGAHDASPTSDAGSVFDRPPSGAGARARRALSPNPSLRSTNTSRMNMSVSSTSMNMAATGEPRLGERVIVSSSRGSKAGTLRYLGPADFAPGLWAGVELDDPIGKNDGSVDGKRYFECGYRFGLFAPASKVSKSPSNRKPGACAIHSNGRGVGAGGVRRSTSRESLTSLGTSVSSVLRLGPQRGAPRATSTPSAKNTLQELLREKQQHLERLLRERELEQAEMARLTLQAGRIEAQLAQFRTDAHHATLENEKLKTELSTISKLLEDERQKVEDLMFKNEEENINKEDYNKYRDAMEAEKQAAQKKIRELEAEVALQAARAQAQAETARALDEQRASEMAALQAQHRDELNASQALSSELQKLLDEAYALLKEKETEKDSMGKSLSEELSKVKAESEKALNDAKSKMAVAQTEFEAQLSVLNAKLLATESKLEAEKNNLERLNKDSSEVAAELNAKLSQVQAALDDKTHELNRVLGSSKEHDLNLSKEITKLKMELSAKVLDMEQLVELNKKNDVIHKELEAQLANVKEDFAKKINEYEGLLSDASLQNDKNISEISDLHQKLSSKTAEYEKLIKELKVTTDENEKLLQEFKEKVNERDKEIIKLKNDYEEANAKFNRSHSVIAEEHKKIIEDRDAKIDLLSKEIENYRQTLDQCKVEFNDLSAKFSSNNSEIKSLNDRNSDLSNSLTTLTKHNEELKAKVASLEIEVNELKRQLQNANDKCNELEKARENIESERMALMGQTTDSTEQFTKLSQHLRETEKELQEMRDKHREKCNSYQKIEEELNHQINQIKEEFELEKESLIKKLAAAVDRSTLLENMVAELKAQIASQLNDATQGHEVRNKELEENIIRLQKDLDDMRSKETELKSELETSQKNSEICIQEYKEKIQILKSEAESSELKLKEKLEQLIEAQNDLNNKLEESRQREETLQRELNEMTNKYTFDRSEFDKQIKHNESELILLKEKIENHKEEKNKLSKLLEEKESMVKEINLQLGMLDIDLKSSVEVISEKDRQIAVSNQEIEKLTSDKHQIEQKLNEVNLELNSLQNKHESLLADSSAEEALAKEQIQQLKVVKNDIETLTKEKSLLETKSQDFELEVRSLRTENQVYLSKIEQTFGEQNRLKDLLKEKECQLNSLTKECETEKLKLARLEEETSKLRKDLEEKHITIAEKDAQISQARKNVETDSTEVSHRLTSLNHHIEELTKQHKLEVSNLSKTISNLEMNAKENEKYKEDVFKLKQKIEELQVLIQKGDDDVKQLTDINNAQRENYDELNKQLQSEYERLKKESKKERQSLKEKLLEYEKFVQDSKDKINSEIAKQVELQTRLTSSEKKAEELKNKVELSSAQHISGGEHNNMLENVTLQLQELRKSSSDKIAASEETVKQLKLEIDNKANELKKKEDLINKLQDEMKCQIVKTEVAQRERKMLEANNNANATEANNKTGQSEGEGETEWEGQVRFLNGVIVDMQRKNEQLVARLHALEAGAPAALPAEDSKPVRARAVAPRLFCDICDVWDAHDTDECPRQGEPDPPPAAPGAPRRPPPAPRPYCDICEVFGHPTEDCDEEETF